MKPKAAVKLITDILMTIALLLLMGYQFWGETPHEWIGMLMFLLFIFHHILNGKWHKNLFKGKYSAIRIITLCVDCLVLLSMIAQIYSGIVMSRHVFSLLPIEGGMAFARRLHILGSYWGFIFMSLHLGLHWNMILGIIKRMKKKKDDRKIHDVRSTIIFMAGLILAEYGAWVFIKREFPTYLFLKTEFVFLDYSEPEILFYIDYLALMWLCIFIVHYSLKIWRFCRTELLVSN